MNPGAVHEQNQGVLSGNYMKKIKDTHQEGANRLLNEYVAYACTLGYHKNIADDVPDAFSSFMPDRQLLRPHFSFLPNKEASRVDGDDQSMGGSSEGAEKRYKQDLTEETRADIETIQAKIHVKGDIADALLETLKTEVKSTPQVQRAILIEMIIVKYILSFEHTLHFIRRVRPVLAHLFDSDPSSHAEALDLILRAYNLDEMATQDFENDCVNLFQVRKKVIKLVLKLVDLGVLQANQLTPFLLQKIKLHLDGNTD